MGLPVSLGLVLGAEALVTQLGKPGEKDGGDWLGGEGWGREFNDFRCVGRTLQWCRSLTV